MATQTSTLQVKGKLGNVVGYKGRGKQLARIRVTEIKNPNSEGQAIQRMITATNARAYSRLKEICDHSFEGVAYKQPSQDYFLKANAKILRSYVAQNYPQYNVDVPAEYVGLSGKSDVYASGVGLVISGGTLRAVTAVRNANGELLGFGTSILESFTIADVLASLGASPGDQITLVGLPYDGPVMLTRYVLNSAITADQAAAAFSGSALAAVCDARSEIGQLYLGTAPATGGLTLTIKNGDKSIADDTAGDLYGCAIILSRKGTDGNWLRSPQKLLLAGTLDGLSNMNTPEDAILEWMAGTTEIDVQSKWYLNQSKAAKASF